MSDLKENALLRKSFDATTIKLIAIVCMFIDHFAAGILDRMVKFGYFKTGITFSLLATDISLEEIIVFILRGIGRVSFPIFCFFIVEGFFHTGKKWKYALRLLLFALISEVPFDLALFGYYFYSEYQNVYFTLLIGLLTIWGIDVMRNHTKDMFTVVMFRIGVCFIPTLFLANELCSVLSIFDERFTGVTIGDLYFSIVWIALAAVVFVLTILYGKKYGKNELRILCSTLTLLGIGMLVADILMTDYSAPGVMTVVLMYLLRGKINKIFAPLFSIIILSLTNFAEIPALVDVFFFAKYDGKRGKGMKYFFYVFYPAHLLIFGIIEKCCHLI